MAKLKILTELSFEGQNMHFTRYKQFLDKIDTQNDGWFYYQDVKLSKYTDKKKYCFNFLCRLYYANLTKCGKKVRKSFNIPCIFESGILAGYINLAN